MQPGAQIKGRGNGYLVNGGTGFTTRHMGAIRTLTLNGLHLARLVTYLAIGVNVWLLLLLVRG